MRARARGTVLRAMLARLRAMDPRRADLLLAGAFYVEVLGELFLLVPADADGKGWVALLLLATAATLAVRRRFPAAAALAAVPFFIVSNSLGDDYIDHMVSPFFAAILVLYGSFASAVAPLDALTAPDLFDCADKRLLSRKRVGRQPS